MRQAVRSIALIVLGSVVFALGFDLFLEPNHINTGGLTGVAMLLQSVLGFGSIGIITVILNIPLFLLGYRFLGKRFFFGSLMGMLGTSAFLEVFSSLPAVQTEPLLATLYGGACVGAGLGLVFAAGASTGGVDIAASLLRKKFSHLRMGKLMLALDALVVTLTGVVYHDISKALYSAVGLYVSSVVLDSVLYGMDKSTVAIIISDSHREIADAVAVELERGVTLLDGHGGHTGKDKTVLLVAVRRRQSARLTQIVRRIDPDAFVILQQAHQVLGEGFARYSDTM
ncbi:MAG: YitT family protein [Oscillospiraceae bacterium]|nr:YitT family protein [Oscillospiraceae bacterium]